MLRLPVDRGGLGVLDFQCYYWAAQLQWIARWVKGIHPEEMGAMGDEPRQGALICRLLQRPERLIRGPCLLKIAMKCWDKCMQDLLPAPRYAPEIPLVGLPRRVAGSPPYYTTGELADWTEADILTVGNCLGAGELLPFDALTEERDLPVGQFLKYESLKNSMRELWGEIGEETQTHEVLQRILTMGRGRHLITWLYKALIDMKYRCPGASRSRWERDLGLQLEDKEWTSSLEHIKKVSRNSRLKYTQFNYVHQCYLDPSKITRIFGGPARTCPRCGSTQATFYHMVWECRLIREFWIRVIARINRTLSRDMPASPLGCLLGVIKRPAKKKAGNRLVDLALGVARKSIAKHWKSQTGPSYEGWVQEVGRWGRAEEELLIKEERIGVRLQLLSPNWKEVIEEFATLGEDSTYIESD